MWNLDVGSMRRLQIDFQSNIYSRLFGTATMDFSHGSPMHETCHSFLSTVNCNAQIIRSDREFALFSIWASVGIRHSVSLDVTVPKIASRLRMVTKLTATATEIVGTNWNRNWSFTAHLVCSNFLIIFINFRYSWRCFANIFTFPSAKLTNSHKSGKKYSHKLLWLQQFSEAPLKWFTRRRTQQIEVKFQSIHNFARLNTS